MARAGKVSMSRGVFVGLALCAMWVSVAAWPALARAAPTLTAAALAPTANFGPYNVTFLEGGVGLARPLSEEAAPIASGAPWSITGWLRSARRQSGEVIVAAIGDVAGGEWRGVALVGGGLSFVAGPAATVPRGPRPPGGPLPCRGPRRCRRAAQDPWTLPQAKSPPSNPLAEPVPAAIGLGGRGFGAWALGSWRLLPAPGLDAGGERLSQPDYDDSRWYQAVVPGTVLTTFI